MLTSIYTATGAWASICSITFTSLALSNEEKPYLTKKTGASGSRPPHWVCPKHWNTATESQQTKLVNDILLELRGYATNYIHGFSTKHDSGNVKVFGR